MDQVNAYCAQGNGFGQWSIQLTTTAGAAVGSAFTCAGSATATAAVLAPSATFSSQIINAPATCATGPCYLFGFEGLTGSNGLTVDNLGAASSVAELYNGSTAFAFADLIPGGFSLESRPS